MMTLLSSTILGAVVAVIVTLVRKHRPSPWGSAFAYGPAYGRPLDGISNQPWVTDIQRLRWSCAAPESID
ncbi:hypothetical protein JCM18918_1307 [Cutibacterium acnes JCM 18918]|nr:hypothetical protein JCM18918_1307 [Cutibacterium acnes JCM 18918]